MDILFWVSLMQMLSNISSCLKPFQLDENTNVCHHEKTNPGLNKQLVFCKLTNKVKLNLKFFFLQFFIFQISDFRHNLFIFMLQEHIVSYWSLDWKLVKDKLNQPGMHSVVTCPLLATWSCEKTRLGSSIGKKTLSDFFVLWQLSNVFSLLKTVI